jgi:hypothetical protein
MWLFKGTLWVKGMMSVSRADSVLNHGRNQPRKSLQSAPLYKLEDDYYSK